MNTSLEAMPIEHLETLQVLVDSQRHRIVTLLMEEPMSAADLAAKLGIARTRLYYHLGLLERHGLIRVAGSRLVSGLEEKRYSAVARRFAVDRKLLAAEASESQIESAQASILEQVAHDLRERSAHHDSAPTSADDEDVFVARTFLQLSERRHRELHRRLSDLLAEYSTPDPGGRSMELGFALFTTEREVP